MVPALGAIADPQTRRFGTKQRSSPPFSYLPLVMGSDSLYSNRGKGCGIMSSDVTKPNRGSIAGEKRENVSMIVSTRSLRPVTS
jgi:hypothetical protein